MKIRVIIFLACVIGTLVSFAQHLPEKGVPLLQTFTPDQYQNRGKIWDISSAPNGIVYMAADKGLIEFDGKTWNSFKGSDGFTRSLKVKNNSTIYTGSDLDFGIWKSNELLNFEYISLYPFREKTQAITEEFWQIHSLQDDIFYVSSRNIYVYVNQQLVIIPAPTGFTGSFRVHDEIYFVDASQGIFVFDDYSLKKVFEFPEGLNPVISGMYQTDQGLTIVTRDFGLYLFSSGKVSRLDNELSEKLKTAKVFSFEPIGQSHLAFGTVLRGLFITDLNGRIIHQINRQKGLPSNTILSMHYAPNGKLWLGTDYGIASLELNSNFTTFYDYRGDFGTGHTALLNNGVFYLGTNQGLYYSNWEELNNDVEFFRFNLIPEAEGQVWTLEKIDNRLLLGHDKGLFEIKGNTIEALSTQEGVWNIVPYKQYLFAGTYNGVSIFHKDGNSWTFLRQMELILGSCNQLIIENDNILWVNIPNFGVIRVELGEDLNPAERLIFPEDVFTGTDASLIKDELGIHLVTNQFQYSFNAAEKKFIQKGKSTNYSEPEGLLPGIYQPLSLDTEYDFYPVYNGFALRYRMSRADSGDQNYSLILRQIEAFNNHERKQIHSGTKVPYPLNNFRIHFIIPNQNEVFYQYELNNSGSWSELTPNNTLEFLNMRHGVHNLSIKAMINEEVPEQLAISFRVATPWYITWYAYVIYLVIISIIVYLIRSWQIGSLKKQKEEMLINNQNLLHQQMEKHKQEIMLLEQKRLQTEYDQLKQQLKSKTIELANKARDNEEKNRLLLTLKEKCEKAQQNPALFEIKWVEMQRILDSYLKIEDKTFEIQMDELHQDLFRKLKDNFPELSSNDLRLCAYLKIGLNSKEIAEILNIQPSSFYISRSRLRKKLNLQPDENLYDFLNSV